MPPFPNISRMCFTSDLDLSPTDLNINTYHLLIMDYLPTRFEGSGAKHFWVISCTRGRETIITFDLALWPTDLNINRDRPLIKDYLPTKFEASLAKRSWVISCTRWSRRAWTLTLTFFSPTDLNIFSSRTTYLLSLKLLGQSVLEIPVAQGIGDQHDLWPWLLTYWPEYRLGSFPHHGLSTYQVWSLWGEGLLIYWMHKLFWGATDEPTYWNHLNEL